MKRLLLSFGILAGLCVQAAHHPGNTQDQTRHSICMAKDPHADAMWQLHEVTKKSLTEYELVRLAYSGGTWHETAKHAVHVPVASIGQAAAVVDDAGSVTLAISSQESTHSSFAVHIDTKGKATVSPIDIPSVSVVKAFALNNAVYIVGQTADALHIAQMAKNSVQSIDSVNFSEIFLQADAVVTDVCADDQGRLYASVVNAATQLQTAVVSFDTQDHSFSNMVLDASAGEVFKIAVIREQGSSQSKFFLVTRDEQNVTRLASMDMYGLALQKGDQVRFDVTHLIASKDGIVVAGYDAFNVVAQKYNLDGSSKKSADVITPATRSGNNKIASHSGVCVLSDGSIAADITYQSLSDIKRNRTFKNVNDPLIAANATVVVPGQLDVILDGNQSLVTITGITLDDATPVDQNGLTAIALSNFSVESAQVAIRHDDQALVEVNGTIDISFTRDSTDYNYTGVALTGYIVVSVDSTASGGNAQVSEGLVFGVIDSEDAPGFLVGQHITITVGDSNVQAPTIEEFTAQVGAGAGGVTFTAAYNGLSTFISVTKITLDSTALSGGWTLGANNTGMMSAEITVSGAGFIALNTLGTIQIKATRDIWLTAPGGTFANPALGSVKIATAGVTSLGSMYFLIDGQGRVTVSPRELECTDEGVCTLQTRLLQIANINHDGDAGTDTIVVSLAINPEIELNLDSDVPAGPVITDLQVGGSASAVSFDKVLYDGTVVYVEIDGITFTGVSATGGLTNYTLSGSSLSGSGSSSEDGDLDISVTGTGTLAVTGYNGTNYSGGGSTSVSLSGTVRVVVDLTDDEDITVSAIHSFTFTNEGPNDDIDGSLNITATNVEDIDDQSTQTVTGSLSGSMIYTGSAAILDVTDVTFTGLDTDWSFTAGPSMRATFAATDGLQIVNGNPEIAAININHYVSTATITSPAGTQYQVIFDELWLDDEIQTHLSIGTNGVLSVDDGRLAVRYGEVGGDGSNTSGSDFTLNASIADDEYDSGVSQITVTYLDLSDAALIGTMTYTGLAAELDITGISFPHLPAGWTFTPGEYEGAITGAFTADTHVMDAANDVALITISGQGTLSNGSESFTISIANTGATAVAIGANGALSVSNDALRITDLNGDYADIPFETNIATLTGITVTDKSSVATTMDAQWQYVYDGVAGIIRLLGLAEPSGTTNSWIVTGAELRWNNEASFVEMLVPALDDYDGSVSLGSTGVATGAGVVANGVVGVINLTDQFGQTISIPMTGTVTPNLIRNDCEYGASVLFSLTSGSLTGSSANAVAPDNNLNDDISVTLTIKQDLANQPGFQSGYYENHMRNIVQQDITSIDGLDVTYNGLYVIIDASDDVTFTLGGVTENDGELFETGYNQAWSFTNISNIEFAGTENNILYLKAPAERAGLIEYTVPITFTADLISTYSGVTAGSHPAFTGLGAVTVANDHTFSGNLKITVDNSGDNIGAGGDQQINVDITGGIVLNAQTPFPGVYSDIDAHFQTSAQDLDVTDTSVNLNPRVHLNFNPESGNTLQYNGIDVVFLGDADIVGIDNHAGWDVAVSNVQWYVSDGEAGLRQITEENPLRVRVAWDGTVVEDIYLDASFTCTPQVPAGSDQVPTSLSLSLSDNIGGPVALKFIVQDDGTVNIATVEDEEFVYESVILDALSSEYDLPQADRGFHVTITLDTDDVENNPTNYIPEFITTEANIDLEYGYFIEISDFSEGGVEVDEYNQTVSFFYERFAQVVSLSGDLINVSAIDIDVEDYDSSTSGIGLDDITDNHHGDHILVDFSESEEDIARVELIFSTDYVTVGDQEVQFNATVNLFVGRDGTLYTSIDGSTELSLEDLSFSMAASKAAQIRVSNISDGGITIDEYGRVLFDHESFSDVVLLSGLSVNTGDIDFDYEDSSTDTPGVTVEFGDDNDHIIIDFSESEANIAQVVVDLSTDDVYINGYEVEFNGTVTLFVGRDGTLYTSLDGSEELSPEDVSFVMTANGVSPISTLSVLYDGVQAIMDLSGLHLSVTSGVSMDIELYDFDPVNFYNNYVTDEEVDGDTIITFSAYGLLSSFDTDEGDFTITDGWTLENQVSLRFVSASSDEMDLHITDSGERIDDVLEVVNPVGGTIQATIEYVVIVENESGQQVTLTLQGDVIIHSGEGFVAENFTLTGVSGDVTPYWQIQDLQDLVVTHAYATDEDDAAYVALDAVNHRIVVNVSQLTGDRTIPVTLGVQGTTSLTYDVPGFDEVVISNVTVTGTVTGTVNRFGEVQITGHQLTASGIYLDGSTTDEYEYGGTGDIAVRLSVNAATIDDIDDISEVQGVTNMSGIAINNGQSMRIMLFDDGVQNLGNCCLADGEELVADIMILQGLTVQVDETITFANKQLDENGAPQIIAYPLPVTGTIGLHYVATNVPVEDVEVSGYVFVNIVQDPSLEADFEDVIVTIASEDDIANSVYLDLIPVDSDYAQILGLTEYSDASDYRSALVARVNIEGEPVTEGGVTIDITLNVVDEEDAYGNVTGYAIEVTNNFCPVSVFSANTNPAIYMTHSTVNTNTQAADDAFFNHDFSGDGTTNNQAVLLVKSINTLDKLKKYIGLQEIYDTLAAEILAGIEYESDNNIDNNPDYWTGFIEACFDGSSNYKGFTADKYNLSPDHGYEQFIQHEDATAARHYAFGVSFLMYKLHNGTLYDHANIDRLLNVATHKTQATTAAVMKAVQTILIRLGIIHYTLRASHYTE
ncbi:hypothetical protein EBQ93_01295 [bacterium]|nr:hypothetical protein [bacterium]